MVTTIDLEPPHVLRHISKIMNGKLDDITIKIPVETTWNHALGLCQEALKDHDGEVVMFPPRSEATKQRVRNIALQEQKNESQSSASGMPGLRIRNAVNPSTLPTPQRASPETRARLKENAKTQPSSSKDPYVTTVRAYREDTKLAVISGKLMLSGIDGSMSDPSCVVYSSDMLFDPGAQSCWITEDMLNDHFRDYVMNDPINASYRSKDQQTVQVDAAFSFATGVIQMSCVFQIVPRSRVPNQRVGVILGQNTFIDQIVYRSIPRAFLLANGEAVDENVWGDIVVERYVDYEMIRALSS